MSLFNSQQNVIYNSFLGRGYRKLSRFLCNKKNENKGEFGAHVVADVFSLGTNYFPMFGTLLSIYRDGSFLFADDFDFAVFDVFPDDMIDNAEAIGYVLSSISIIGHKREIIEYSFQKEIDGKLVKVDFFKLKTIDGVIRHYCPNFRKEKEYVSFENGLKICSFNSFFYVDYPYFNLVDSSWGVKVPEKPEEIFELHYGKDWKIPKIKDFIDFEAYYFVQEKSMTVVGDSSSLKKYIKNISS
ncbi:hypothetical protein [Citrobacter gillenii]|uniref:hypothetical protein n=1 Tax=Citrobacter gillenii TaxID=67828 RepID=UPI003988636D